MEVLWCCCSLGWGVLDLVLPLPLFLLEPDHARPSLLWLTKPNYSHKRKSWFGGYLNRTFKHFSSPWAGAASLCWLQEGCSPQTISFLTLVLGSAWLYKPTDTFSLRDPSITSLLQRKPCPCVVSIPGQACGGLIGCWFVSGQRCCLFCFLLAPFSLLVLRYLYIKQHKRRIKI